MPGCRMKTKVAALVGGLVGGLGVLCFLVAFGTDYWLLASDDCEWLRQLEKTPKTVHTAEQANSTEVTHSSHATRLAEL